MITGHICSVCGIVGTYTDTPQVELGTMCITGVRYDREHNEVDNYHHENKAECIQALMEEVRRLQGIVEAADRLVEVVNNLWDHYYVHLDNVGVLSGALEAYEAARRGRDNE